MKKTLMLIIILVSLLGFIFFLLTPPEWKTNLVSPMGQLPIISQKTKQVSTPIPTPAPPVAPKTFQFDRNTDLNTELEKVNPEVLDSDFQ